jgi:hypothetical protein
MYNFKANRNCYYYFIQKPPSPLNPWVEIYNRAEFGAGVGFAAFE